MVIWYLLIPKNKFLWAYVTIGIFKNLWIKKRVIENLLILENLSASEIRVIKFRGITSWCKLQIEPN